MATIGNSQLTLLDHAKRIDENGKIARIVEMMSKRNAALEDAVVIEGNTTSGHKTTLRTGLPTVAWRQINKGIQPTKSSTSQIEFTAGMLEAHGQVDEELVNLASDKQAFRLSENAPFIEAMTQTLATTMFYGNVNTNPERFMGLAPYYSSLSAASGANIVDGGGTGSDNTSIYGVVWGENSIHGFFPKGTQAGIQHADLGLQLVEDGITTGAKYRAWVDQYKAKMGMVVRDWRQGFRLANLDVSDLATAGADTDTSANLINLLIKAINKIENPEMGKMVLYCNREVKTALDIMAINRFNVQLTIGTLQDGSPITRFMGYPIRRVDAIVNTEARVV